MKRFHVHLGVKDLASSVDFYSALFGSAPSLLKADYAKWMLEDPRLNFAISTRSGRAGLDHLGIQATDDAELADIENKLKRANPDVFEQKNTHCCYAAADKYWVQDPVGIAWEGFHTLNEVPLFSQPSDTDATTNSPACCAPSARAAACC